MKPLATLILFVLIATGFFVAQHRREEAADLQKVTTANRIYWCIERRSFMYPPLYHITSDIVLDCAVLNGSNIHR